MRLAEFKLERYFARYEFSVPHLLCASDCESMSVRDLLAMEPGAGDALHDLWLGYTESAGHPALREQIAALYEGIGPEQVLVHAGAEEAIFNLMNVLLGPGDHAIVHTPCYQSLFEVARAAGCRVDPWEAREDAGWALDLDTLRRALRPETRLVVVNCPHNPTGYVMPGEAFAELVALSQERGFLLFSDEVYRGLEADPRDRLPALCEVDPRGVSLGVTSKSYGLAGLRIGWVATRNAPLLARLAAFKDYTTICSSAPSEFLAALALRHGPEIVARNRALIRDNLAALDAFFRRHEDRFCWTPPRAGPIAFPSLRQGDVEAYCDELVSGAGVLLLPGTTYGPYERNFRIGFGRGTFAAGLRAWEDHIHAH